jgi:beta-lactamase regulating signal transducer with metallopeptidase domain
VAEKEKRMIEHITHALYYFEVHLLYATLVWFAAWALTSIPRVNATTRYWIWVLTALNFVIPVGAAVDKFWGWHLTWARPLGAIGDAGLRIMANGMMFSTVWLLGAMLMAGRLVWRLRADHRDARSTQNASDSNRNFVVQGTPVEFSHAGNGPVVDGVLHPHICLPSGIDRLLTKPELNAVLIHELTHAKRLDNLIRLIYEVERCVLWFHPLVWLTGYRLALYRELSCDESVIQSAHGGELVSALAKLANPGDAFLLQARASSFLSSRLARLNAAPSRGTNRIANLLVDALFGAALLAGILGTVAHTACCWIART